MAERRALIVINGLNEASGTVRARQYEPYFGADGPWTATFVERRSAQRVWRANRFNRPDVPLVQPLVHRPLQALTRRWERQRETEILQIAATVDLVYVVKVPDLGFYQGLRALNGPVIVADFNDAVWLPSFPEWRDLDGILQTAHGVICENERVAGYARRHNQHVTVVPDSPQVEVFDRWRGRVTREPGVVTFGWLGGAENAGSLYRIFEPLEALAARMPQLRLRIVGADGLLLPRFESVRWSSRAHFDQETMVQEVLRFDVGLFPMFHTADGLGRGNLKAMIYMAGGCVALCEDYGENPALIDDGVNGVLAASPDAWLHKMEWLATDATAREAIAARGLQTIRDGFSAPVVARKLQAAFSQIVDAVAPRTPVLG